jgi:hypothetical protein
MKIIQPKKMPRNTKSPAPPTKIKNTRYESAVICLLWLLIVAFGGLAFGWFYVGLVQKKALVASGSLVIGIYLLSSCSATYDEFKDELANALKGIV